MKQISPDIRIIEEPSIKGVPFPDEKFDPVGLSDPEELRDALDAQAVARRVLPYIDTRAAHWRYYLFAAPSQDGGRPIAIEKRLVAVLEQTNSQAGIGRREYSRFVSDMRRSEKRFTRLLLERYKRAYGTATKSFWESIDKSPGAPSVALCRSARAYVLSEKYADYFAESCGTGRVRHLFGKRLRAFRPGLASLIESKNYVLERAAAAAASSSKIDDDDRLLFLTWAVLQAFYGIADDGRAEEPEDEVEAEELADEDKNYRILAQASIDLLDRMKKPGNLTTKQAGTIRQRLWNALKHKGKYAPPIRVWSLKNDGTRRRVFASLRLYTYRRLLRATRLT